jgi:uncharacterized protein GlcG (DUF336 family)
MTAPLDLTLALAEQIIAAALQKGKEMDLKPLTVAVLDRGGHLIALVRQDGSSLLRPQIAMGKASSALALGVSSRTITTMAAERPSFIAALGPISPQSIIPAPGGLLIKGHDGVVIGAVGISGDHSDNDEACALHGLAVAGLEPLN